MNTNAICKKLNVSKKALRIYEELGIIVPKRDDNNYRNYDKNDILKLRQILFFKEMGIPLKNIGEVINNCLNYENDVVRMLDIQLKAVDKKINELKSIKSILYKSINEILNTNNDFNLKDSLDEIDKLLSVNKVNKELWLDKWEFDSWAENYDDTVKENTNDELGIFEKYDFLLDNVVRIIYENNAKNIIDIGCGTGNLYGKLNNDINYIGLDQSIEMLLQAKRKFPIINLRIGNFLDRPFVENKFDIVVSTFAFHHLNPFEKRKAIEQLLYYLKSKGRIVIGDLMFLNSDERMKKKESLLEINRADLWDLIEDEYYTDIEEIQEYAQQLGCIVKFDQLTNLTWLLQIIRNM